MGWPITHPSTIYAIRNKKTGRVYIGRTYRFEARIKEHFYELRKGQKRFYQHGTKDYEENQFQKDYRKYGEDSFEVYIIEENVEPSLCKEREAFWIAEYNSSNPLYGYNKLTEADKIVIPEPKRVLPPNRYANDYHAKRNRKKQIAPEEEEASV